MCLISVPNLKEIHPGEGCFYLAQSYCCKSVQRRRKMWRKLDNFQKCISYKLLIRFSLNVVCKVVYMEGIKYVNLIEISPAVIKMWGVENGDLAVPVNSTLVCACLSWPLIHNCMSWCPLHFFVSSGFFHMYIWIIHGELIDPWSTTLLM